jgi:hypothetical protein
MLTTLLSATVSVLLAAEPPTPQPANTLSPAEITAGWKLLFDGTSTDQWRSYKKDSFPAKGWVVEDGALHVTKGGGGGDILSKDQYTDFELIVDFKCAPAANSGIMYRCAETKDYPWMTGPEYQILDDAGHADGADVKHRVGALYDMIPAPTDKPAAKAGEWNTARIRIKDGILQHFLNGYKTAECRIDDAHWTDMIAASKFKQWPGFGLETKGYLALQDHGDDVWFRNIKVRDLTAPMPGENPLFNGKDLIGWTPFVPELSKDGKSQSAPWSVKDGILICSGNPAGYIHTNNDFTSYILKLEWRFNPETKKAGNSGVLLRVQEPHKVWPKSIEAQLQSGSAGDFWCIDEFPMKTDDARRKGRNTKHTHAAEHPVGEWNDYEIIVDGGNVTLRVNGEEINSATDCQVVPGKIALQSEGAEIQFRNIRLSPIK